MNGTTARAGVLSRLGLVLALGGCTGQIGSLEEEHGDDDATALEGADVVAALDPEGASAPVQAPEAFIRLGLMWEGDASALVEVRTSEDGTTWSDWMTPEIVSEEEGSRVALVNVQGEPALYYRYRVPAEATAPTHIVFEPIASLPEIEEGEGLVPDEEVEESELSAGDDVAGAQAALTLIGGFIHRRSAWGARPPRCATPMDPYRVTVHHTVTPTRDSMSPQARLRQIQSYHMNVRGYCDIAYNYLISRDGRVWVGRGGRRMGGHTYNNNSGNVGISFMGTYTSTAANDAQVQNAVRLLRLLRNRFGISLNRTRIKGHRQYGATGGGTACPGDRLYRQLDGIVARARR